MAPIPKTRRVKPNFEGDEENIDPSTRKTPSDNVHPFILKCNLKDRAHISGIGSEVFTLYQRVHGQNFQMSNGAIVPIIGRGTVKFLLEGNEVILHNTYHIPAYGNMIHMSLAIHAAQYPNCGVFHHRFLVFPNFPVTFARVGVYITDATFCNDLNGGDCVSVDSLYPEIDDSDFASSDSSTQ